MTGRDELERLWEGRVVEGVDLTRTEAAALSASPLVTVQPGAGGWRVTAAYAAGALRVGELVVRVRPKVGALQVLRLLARAYRIDGLQLYDPRVGVDEDDDLTSLLALVFAQEAGAALASGPLRGYRTEDQTLSVLRGRLRLRDQEARRFGQLVPLEVTVDEWTTDTDENRLIRMATQRLLRLHGLPTPVMGRLRRVDRLLADVTVPARGAQAPRWTPTRLNASLHRLLRLAELVLAHCTVEHRAGALQVGGFVVRMEWLFETLVARLLAEHDGALRVISQQTYPLDEDALLTIRPDLVVRDGAAVVAVADTKYKLLGADGKLPTADAYQMVTYCRRLGLDVGHLIYAADDSEPSLPLELSVVGADARIVLHRLDLASPVSEIEAQVAALRATIDCGLGNVVSNGSQR